MLHAYTSSGALQALTPVPHCPAAGMATEAFTDFVVGHGELWSALLFSATVKALGHDCQFMDTREVLVVTPTSDGNSVDIQYDLSNDRLDAWVRNNGAPEVIVATGFIAKNPLGQVSSECC